MKTISSHKDTDALTLSFVAEFDASVDRVWRLWEDPRQLERWWGAPTWPATFDRHSLEVGGESRYYMTGPDGEKAHGWWKTTLVDAPQRLEFDDGFGDANGDPDPSIEPIHAVLTLEAMDGGTRMKIVSTFASAEHLDQMVAMGMEEGMGQALGQILAILAEDPE